MQTMTADASAMIERARYDLACTQTVFDGGKYLYVYFTCQQAVEKALKALIIERTGRSPPRILDLRALAQQAGIADELSPERLSLLARLTELYVGVRYAIDEAEIASLERRDDAEAYMQRTRETFSWIESLLT